MLVSIIIIIKLIIGMISYYSLRLTIVFQD